jgi:SAM-dependent methyltransferase
MLDMAEVSPNDFVIDLGSGDGRNVIAAAKRGARALGVEYNPDLVELSRQHAAAAHVSDKATFVQGDMYAADVSQATVLALFLTPEVLDRMTDKFLAMKPGARIVLNSFPITDWEPDETETIASCKAWCTAILVIVPARVDGTWQWGDTQAILRQGLSVHKRRARRPAGDWTPSRAHIAPEIREHRVFRGSVCRSNRRHGNDGRTSNAVDRRPFATPPVTLCRSSSKEVFRARILAG